MRLRVRSTFGALPFVRLGNAGIELHHSAERYEKDYSRPCVFAFARRLAPYRLYGLAVRESNYIIARSAMSLVSRDHASSRIFGPSRAAALFENWWR